MYIFNKLTFLFSALLALILVPFSKGNNDKSEDASISNDTNQCSWPSVRFNYFLQSYSAIIMLLYFY